jgi:predicted enzyme related to lactoylglutathione lyase
MTPRGRLEYLYMGTADFARDLAWWRDVMRGEVAWNFEAFGARVAALRVWEKGPLLLVADHRPAPSLLPVFAVDDLEAAMADLQARGWRAEGDPFGIPDGPCVLFKDPSGNEFAMYGDERPHALDASYREPANPRAVR